MDPKSNPGQPGAAGAPEGTPEVFTREEAEKLTESVANKFKAEQRKLLEKLAKDQEAFAKSLDERFASLKPAQPEPTPEGGKTAEQRQAEIALAKQEQRIKEMEARLQESEQRRLQEEQARLAQEERTALSQALTGAGVDPDAIGLAMASLYTEQKRVARNDQGAIFFKVSGQYGEELLPLSEGIAAWLKTSEGKRCLPARGATGSGTVAGQPGGNRSGGKMTKAEALQMLPGALRGLGSQ